MDNSIKELEKIGLKEVCLRTHIEVKQLEYMINNQYDKLSKINTLGFVKIISREYKLDLTDWLEGFYDYCAEHKDEDEPYKEKIYICAKSKRPYKKAVWLFLLIVFISGLFGVFSIFKDEIDFDVMRFLDKEKTETNQSSSAFQSTPVVQEAATSLGVKVEERVVETNSSNATVEAVVVKIDDNNSQKTDVNETSVAPLPMIPESNTTLISTVPDNKAILVPTKRIWVGIINLKTYNRTESSNDQNITIDLTKHQIIKTGNGFFKLSYDGSMEDFTEQGSTRFLVENGTMKKISEEKFTELNRGKNW